MGKIKREKKNWYQKALEAKKARPLPQQEYFYDEASLLDYPSAKKGLGKIIKEGIEAGRVEAQKYSAEGITKVEIVDIEHEEITPKKLNP